MTVGQPFDAIADTYDQTFSNSLIGRAQRRLVWMETDRRFRAGQRILEINCGTGLDAIHLANRGIQVLACDSSPRMIAKAEKRLEVSSIRAAVEFRCIPTEQIGRLENRETYDGVLSNFAGLNCVADLIPVVRDLALLVRTGGKAILCFFGPVCLWEAAYYLARRQPQKAFRRFARSGVVAPLADGSTVVVRYPTVQWLRRAFWPYFRLESWKGVGVAVPPSYLEHLATRFPRLFAVAAETDTFLGGCPGVRALADHMVLTFERSVVTVP